MKNSSGALATITSLVEINHRRLSHYKRAADKAKDIELKIVFMRYAVQSQGFVNVLNRWMMEYGVDPVSNQEDSNLMSAWSRIKDSLASAAPAHLLGKSELVEQEILRIYKTILSLNILPSPVIRDLERQCNELQSEAVNMKVVVVKPVGRLQVAA